MSRITKSTKQLYTSLAIGAVLVGSMQSASAATNANTLTVTSSIPATCTIAAAAISFGVYTGAQIFQSGTISVQCPNSTPYNITMDSGLNGSTFGASYSMAFGTNKLGYSISNVALPSITSTWPTAPGVAGVGSGAMQNITVYGMLPAGQTGPVGNYSDTITMTITF